MGTPVEPTAGDTTTAIALKLERQAILHDKSKHFEFLLTESALLWQLCEPSVMAVQLDRLVPLSRLPNIRIGVLPFGIQVGDGPYHTFVIYDDHMVTIELFTGQLILRDPKDIDHYHALASFFGGHALWKDAARDLISETAAHYRAAG